MAGHYPPICYPSQGWEASGEPNHVEFKVGANDIQTVRYEFHRRAFDHDRVTRIYGFFAVPDHGYPDDMAEIRAIAANYVDRPFGAAQIQIVFDDSVDRGDEINIVSLVLSQISDTLRVLADPAWRRK
jgi:hypothetical protein